MRGVYHFETGVYYTTEPETEAIGLWFYPISQIIDVLFKKHLLTEKKLLFRKVWTVNDPPYIFQF